MQNVILKDGSVHAVSSYEDVKDLIRDYMGDDLCDFLDNLERDTETKTDEIAESMEYISCTICDLEGAFDKLFDSLKDLDII